MNSRHIRPPLGLNHAPLISPSRRLRRTPFSEGVEAAGVQAYTVYNRMLLPTVFHSAVEDYHHLKSHVQLWDVACERQVAIQGPDARQLLQWITPRDISNLSPHRCFYLPVVDDMGKMLNDPVGLYVESDHYWVSLADSDLLFWIKGLAVAAKLNVRVWEPDVSPLAVQGPKSDAVMAKVFGESVTQLKFFGVGVFHALGHYWRIARSGYSKQGGFEIYVEGTENGMMLWEALMKAGADHNIRAGCPSAIERIEGGLLSFGNDITSDNSPIEAGLGRFVSAHMLDTCLGGEALRAELENGPARMIRPMSIDGVLPVCDRTWPVYMGERLVGQVTSAAYSPDFAVNVAIGMIDQPAWLPGTQVSVYTQSGEHSATIHQTFWN